MKHLDALVLGAGPSGFSVSRLLTKKGYEVEIVDPAFFPRSKICGEFLNPQAVRWLEEEDLLAALLSLNPHPIHGMKICDLRGRSFTGHYVASERVTGFAVMRKELDSLLVKCATEDGIVIRQGHRAERLIIEGGRAVGASGTDTEGKPFVIRARVVIGADGRNNLIGRTFGWMKAIRKLRKHAFSAYFERIPDAGDFGEIHLIDNGYIGIAPLSAAVANVALVLDEEMCPGGGVDLEAFLLHQIQRSGLRRRFEGKKPVSPVMTVGPLGFEVKRTSGYGTLLVGDACGFIDPFTGEGINYAFLSARMAAEILEKAFQTNDFSDDLLGQYDKQRRIAFGRKLRMARLLQKAIEWPWLSGFLVRRFAGSLDLADAMVSAVGSAVPIEEVWNMRFLLRIALMK